jgi:hypothetical protein
MFKIFVSDDFQAFDEQRNGSMETIFKKRTRTIAF